MVVVRGHRYYTTKPRRQPPVNPPMDLDELLIQFVTTRKRKPQPYAYTRAALKARTDYTTAHPENKINIALAGAAAAFVAAMAIGPARRLYDSITTTAQSITERAADVERTYETIKTVVEDYQRKIAPSADTAISIANTYQSWSDDIVNLRTRNLPPDKTVTLLTIKTLIHSLYFIYTGDYANATAWLSNLAIIHPKFVVNVAALPLDLIARAFQNPKATINILGRDVDLDATQWAEYLRYCDSNPEDPSGANFPIIQTEDSVIGNTLGSLFSAISLPGLTQEDVRHFNNQFTFMNHVKRNTTDAVATIEKIISALCRTLFSVDPFDPVYQKFTGRVVDIIEYAMQESLDPSAMVTDKLKMSRHTELHKESVALSVDPRLNMVPKSLQTAFMVAHKKISDLAAQAYGLLRASMIRKEPLSVLVVGKAGSGKTLLNKYIAKNLSFRKAITFDGTQVYTKDFNDAYWEGYAKQRFMFIDDVWQSTDSDIIGAQTEAIISMINTAPMSLNMARLEDKGNNYFDSDYVFMTSNIVQEDWKNAELKNLGVNDPAAIQRRIHLVFHRSDKSNDDISLNKYMVQKCPLPGYTGALLTPAECAELVDRCKNYRDGIMTSFEVDDATLQRHVAATMRMMPPSTSEPVVSPESFIWTHYNPLELYIKCSDLGIYSWTESEYASYYIAAFAVLTGIAVVGAFSSTIMSFFSPTDDPAVSADYWVAYPGGPTKSQYFREGNRFADENAHYAMSKSDRKYHEYWESHNNYNGNTQSSETNFATSIVRKVSDITMRVEGVVTAAGKTRTNVGHAIHVSDGVCITTGHWANWCINNDADAFHIFYRSKKYTIPFPKDGFIFAPDTDLCTFQLPSQVPLPSSCLTYFPDRECDLDIPDNTGLQILTVDDYGAPTMLPCMSCPYSNSVKYSDGNRDVVIMTPLAYQGKGRSKPGCPTNMPTMPGDSGCAIVRMGPQGRVIIVGMHVASDSREKFGLAVRISREYLSTLLKKYDKPAKPNSKTYVEVVKKDTIIPESGVSLLQKYFPDNNGATASSIIPNEHLIPEYTCFTNKTHRPPEKTKLKKTAIYGRLQEPTTLPANLHTRNGDRKAILVATDKLIFTEHKVPSDFYRISLDFLKKTYPRNRDYARILTREEAVNGVTELNIAPIHTATSAGFGFSKEATNGKDKWLVPGDGGKILTPEIHSILDEYENDMARGLYVPLVLADALKDEPRPLAKVNKPRLISSAQVHHTIKARQMFGSLVGYCASLCVTHPVAVGINAHSIDWFRLEKRILEGQGEVGSIIAGDFKNYDATIPPEGMRVVFDFINWWYDDGEANAKVRLLMRQDYIQAVHVVYDMVYKPFGLGSGIFGTSFMGSLNGACCTNYVLHRDFGVSQDEYQATYYGDDNVIGVRRPGITANDMAVGYKMYFGMTYTDFTKEESSVHHTIRDIRYLGRSFTGSRKRAPLELSKILAVPDWYYSPCDLDVVMTSMVCAMIEELSHHTEETFDHWVAKIYDVLSDSVYRKLLPLIQKRVKPYYQYYCDKYHPKSIQRHITPESSQPNHMYVDDTRNEQFTTRANKDPTATQDTQVAEFHDVAPVTDAVVDRVLLPDPYDNANMDSYDMNGGLDRLISGLAAPAWNSTQAQSTFIATYLFPDIFMADPYFANHVSYYRYLTGAIEMTFRTTCASTRCGKLMAFFTPHPGNDQYFPTDCYRASGSPHILLGASAGDTVIFRMPFISQYRFLDLTNFAPGEMGRLDIVVVNSLYDVLGATAGDNILVTARLVDAKVYFPHAPPPPPAAATFVKYSNVDEVEVQPENGIKTSGASKVEARMKSAQGVISSNLQTQDPGTSLIKRIPFLGTIVDTFKDVAETALLGSALLGLSKPTTLDTTSLMKINPHSDGVYGKGISLIPKFAEDAENGISTDPRFGVSTDEMDLKQLLGTPTMLPTISWVKGTAPAPIVYCSPYDNGLTIVDWVTRNFVYAYGSYQVMIDITASSMHSCRFVLWLSDSTTAVTDYTNCIHKYIDVQGDTTVCFTIPYMRKEIATVNSATSNFCVWAKLITFSTPVPNLSCPVHFNVYKSGGPDFKVMGLLSNAYTPNNRILDSDYPEFPEVRIVTPENNVRETFSQEFPPFHESITGYQTSGFIFGEEAVSLRDTLHRMVPMYQSTTVLNPGYIGSTANATRYGLEKWSLLYRYNRGSIRIRGIYNDSRLINSITMRTITDNYVGSYFSTPGNPMVEGELPYYSNHLFRHNSADSNIGFSTSNCIQQPYLLKSTGDDFSYHWIRCPPYGTFSTGTAGLIGMNNFLTGAQPLKSTT